MLGFVVGIFVGWVADSQLKKIQRWPLRVPAYLVTWIAFQWIFFIVSIIIGIATTAELTEGPGFMGMTFGMTVALLLSLFRGPYEEIDEQQQLLDDVVAQEEFAANEMSSDEEWELLRRFDADVRSAVEIVIPYGPIAVNGLRKAMHAVGDKSELPRIANEIVARQGQ